MLDGIIAKNTLKGQSALDIKRRPGYNTLRMKSKILKLTCLLRREGDQYSSLCLELDVASCGRTREEALEGLKAAVETYIEYMIEQGREDEIYRPVPPDAIREFLLGEAVEERKLVTVYALPLEFSYGTVQ